MLIEDLTTYRLSNQQISGTKLTSPESIVSHMGAMQSQNYSMSKWAIGIRLTGSTDQEIEHAINKGKIIRTHVLRPTWHLVSPLDVRWMLELSSEQIKKAMRPMNKQLELTDKEFTKSNKIILKALHQNEQMTREQLMQDLNDAGIETNSLRGAHLMLNAELDQIVCNGASLGKEFTYVLLDERAPKTKSIIRQEAIHTLAKRFFNSHGPATIHDFTWWSGLTSKDAREGFENVKSDLNSEIIDGNEYWFADIIKHKAQNTIYFLPAFDEFIISYKDRSASLHSDFLKTAITNNGIFKPMIIENGKVVGTWKRAFTKNDVIIETELFVPKSKLDKKVLKLCQDKFKSYFGLNVVIK